MQRKTVKRDESAQKIHPRPTRDSVSRRASVGAARVRGTRIFYVRCTSARMTRGITAKFAPKSAPIRAPGQVFSKSFTPIPLLKQRNSFSDFENTPLFACRRRSTENSAMSPMRPISSAEAHPSARRGYADNLRSGHIRARDNRGIRPEICPNIRTARNFFENFKKNFVFGATKRQKISSI